jgi:RimJ/RimL family protein N-acetyltransferase
MIDIRPARAEDEQALATIDLQTWSTLASPAPEPDPGRTFFNDQTAPEQVLVAESDGVVAGYVRLHQTIRLPSHAHVLEIGIAVAPEHQGHGIGGQLLQEAKLAGAQRGARKLTLRVLAANAGARRLYERCGFTVEGVLEAEFLLDGELVDDVMMACRIA